jgi:hypothetical protein
MNAREWFKKLIEKGARNSANDATMIQSMHDNSVSLGATCAVNEAADFSNNDVMTLLNTAVKKQFKAEYSYPYIYDVFDDNLVFGANYSASSCYRVDYSVNENGAVTLGQPVAVVRKVTYIEPNTVTSESDVSEAELISDSVALIETVETDLTEANTRMLKLIAPGWGSSGYYSADVLKRDAGVFKAGTHNYIDHLTEQEKKHKPEGFVDRLASVLKEDAKWYDDYNGHGAGLYAPATVKGNFNEFLNTFGTHIGTSINANGKVKIGEAENKKGPIIEAITGCRSVDYVTVPGAGGKVLDLVESLKNNGGIVQITPDNKIKVAVLVEKEKEVNNMSDQTALQETINRLNAKLTKTEATQYARTKINVLRVKDAVKDRIVADCVRTIPLDESGDIDFGKFDTLIEASVKGETDYLTSVGALGKISGFGGSATPNTQQIDTAKAFSDFQESLKELD